MDQLELFTEIDFYFKNLCDIKCIEILENLISFHSYEKITLRFIDKCLILKNTKYSEFKKQMVKKYGVHNFSVFRRRNRFEYIFNNGKKVETTLAQLNCFKLLIEYNMLNIMIQEYDVLYFQILQKIEL